MLTPPVGQSHGALHVPQLVLYCPMGTMTQLICKAKTDGRLTAPEHRDTIAAE